MKRRKNNNTTITNINSNNSFILLLIAAPASMIAGVLFPSAGLVLERYLLVWLSMLLFINLIRLNPKGLLATFLRPRNIVIMSVLKLLVIPLEAYILTYLIYPKLTLPVTLLSGISTALGAPFAVNFIGRRVLLFALYGLTGYYYHYYYFALAMIGRRMRSRTRENKVDDNSKGEEEKEDKITGLLAMTYISNVLVVVIAHQFFDIQTEALAAFYQIPYYAGLFLLKKLID